MAEPGNQFAIVEFPFGSEFAVVEFSFVGFFGFAEHHMQQDAQALSVGEHDLPLL